MIIIKLQGGLGNQLFQYAFGRMLTNKNNTELVLDNTNYPKDKLREFNLHHFNIKARLINDKENIKYNSKVNKLIRKIKRFIKPHQAYTFNIKELNKKDNSYIEGYWQSQKYFYPIEKDIRKELTLKNHPSKTFQSEYKLIQSCPVSVSIHIRRGDYANNPDITKIFGLCDLNYYKKAIEIINSKYQNCTFFVSSDDTKWAKENIPNIIDKNTVHYVSNPDLSDYEELVLMSKCHHQIIANSSFSWWAGWLNENKNKTIIAPQKWMANPKIKTPDIIPDKWIKI
jgi:hypothetical protein